MHTNRLAALLVTAILAVPAAARAQMHRDMDRPQPTEGTMFGVGAGLTLPMGNYSTADKLGFHGMGLVQFPLHHTPIHLRADVMFSTTSHKNNVSGSTHAIGGTFNALYHLGEPSMSVRPYILGGLGLFNVGGSYNGVSGSNTNIALDFGAGILFGIGASTHAFVEGRYMDVMTCGGSTAFIPITFGLMFGSK